MWIVWTDSHSLWVSLTTCFPVVFFLFFFSPLWARLSCQGHVSRFCDICFCLYPVFIYQRAEDASSEISLRFWQDWNSFSSAELREEANVWSIPLRALKDDSVLLYLTLLWSMHFISLLLPHFCCLRDSHASVVWDHVSLLMVRK